MVWLCFCFSVVISNIFVDWHDICNPILQNCPRDTGSIPWWHHQMETFFALLALCVGNSPVTGELPTQRPVTRGLDFFSLICAWINGWVKNREAGDWRSYRAHYDVTVMLCRSTNEVIMKDMVNSESWTVCIIIGIYLFILFIPLFTFCFPSLVITMIYFEINPELAKINSSRWQKAFWHYILQWSSVYISTCMYIHVEQRDLQKYMQYIYHKICKKIYFALCYYGNIISSRGFIFLR